MSHSPAVNEAERLIEMACIENRFLQAGKTINDICDLLDWSLEHCECALAFFKSKDEGLKFRALVEDWTLLEISERLTCEECVRRELATR